MLFEQITLGEIPVGSVQYDEQLDIICITIKGHNSWYLRPEEKKVLIQTLDQLKCVLQKLEVGNG